MTTALEPRAAVAALADHAEPYLLGVRHHSPALAAAVPALLDACRAEVVCVELPAEFQPWLAHLAAPETVAPVALAGTGEGGRLGFYPFADFSPELAAVRWAREHGADVVCCDLPMSDPRWHTEAALPAGDTRTAVAEAGTGPGPAPFAEALAAAGTGRDGDDLWDRCVEVLAPGCTPEAIRRAALGVGWALRRDAESAGGVPEADLAREAHMRETIARAGEGGRRVAAVVGAFHAPALTAPDTAGSAAADTAGPTAAEVPGSTVADPAGLTVVEVSGSTVADPAGPTVVEVPGSTVADPAGPAAPDIPASAAAGTTGPTATGVPASTAPQVPAPDTPGRSTAGRPAAVGEGPAVVTSLVPYAFDLLDSRSGYPAGIRDPRWQQAVFTAAGDPAELRRAAARAITDVCRELRAAGHTASTGEAAETLRVACDLAALRGLAAPGRGEILEALTAVMGQGEPLGRGRALARALETVLVGTDRGRTAPGTPRSGLGPSVEAELAALRLPHPDDPAPREIRLDPLRSALDGRREILLQRLAVCAAGYGEPVRVTGTGDGTALTTRWRLSWSPSVPVRLDLAGTRGVTAALAAEGTLRETFRKEAADGGPTCALVLAGLEAAARCDLPALLAERLTDAAEVLPATATLPELLTALDLLEALRREHLPGTTPQARRTAAQLATELLDAAVRALPGLAGSDDPQDAAALVALSARAGEHRLGLRMDDALRTLARDGSPLVQGAALASRALLDLDPVADLGARAAGWTDTATTPDGRRALARRLTGLLSGAAPLLQSAPAALDPLLERIDTLSDQEFLDRLPALRGGFDTLTPAGRDRLLHTVTERLGHRVDLSLNAPPHLLALWTAADTTGRTALTALGLPTGTEQPAHPATQQTHPVTPPAPEHPAPRPGPAPRARELPPTDRWRLLLGRETDRLPQHARRYAHALDELYGAGRGEGSADLGRGDGQGQGGGQGASFPTAREWAEELQALFGTEVREEVLARAADQGRTDVLTELDPDAVRPSIDLLTSVLSLAGGLPEHHLARLRPLVRRLVDELARELATRMRPALTGLATPRPTRRPGGRLDLPRTLRANLAHTRRTSDGRTLVVPQRPVFSTRSRTEADWRLILVVDVSASMEASVVWSALTAAVLGGVPTLSTHFLAFSTEVIDFTDRVDDPLSLLLEVRVGGGTHIAAGLAHARTLVTVPSRTLVVVVSDFEEGAPLGGLLGEVRSLAGSGAHLLGCAALDDSGAPRYSVPVARQLVAAGMPVAALSPQALARWVGDRLRGESR
ncbi:DUF5682 family protein [Streptomyces sp. NPDC000987]|uniref:vWA domain-containing protein n=1 Tax=Streptomyces sp. NPDC000987 TaxID=3154374 RepID=UPI0033252861